jgi:hypothetical protein
MPAALWPACNGCINARRGTRHTRHTLQHTRHMLQHTRHTAHAHTQERGTQSTRRLYEDLRSQFGCSAGALATRLRSPLRFTLLLFAYQPTGAGERS